MTRLACVVALLLAAGGFAAEPPGRGEEKPDPCAGIAPVSVSTASGGYLLTLRYKVLDPARAAPLFDKAVKPRLVNRATGEALAMPQDSKLGALRSSPRAQLVAGKQYFVLFSNADRTTRARSHVDVVLGACRLHDLVVQ
jgi:hypothetical protein